MTDWSEIADGHVDGDDYTYPKRPPMAVPPKTGPELVHDEVTQLRAQLGETAAAMQKMQESICHLENHVHRLLNQEGEL